MTRFAGRVLVTGADGFIGKALIRTGADVIGVTRADADLADARSVSRLFAEVQPDSIIHLAAAGVAGRLAHSPELIATNVTMTANVLAAAPPGSQVVIAGSMSEYGRSGTLREDGLCTPRTAYGISKLASTLFSLAYPGEGSVVIARLFGVFGPGEPPSRLMPSLIAKLRVDQPVDLSDGLQIRDFIHVDDAAWVLLSLCSAPIPQGGIVNVGTGTGVRIRDVTCWIAEAVGADADLLRFGARDRSPGDEDALIADVTLLQNVTGSHPEQRLGPELDIGLIG